MIVGALEIQILSDLSRLRKDMNEVVSTTQTMSNRVESAARLIRNALATLGAGALVAQFIQVADAVQLMDARLKLAVRTEEKFLVARQQVYDISQRNLVSLEATAKVFSRLNPVVEAMGGNLQYTAAVSEALAAGLRVSGASTQEASSVMIQFSQAMSSGVLRGEEFNSVSENGSRVIEALGNQLGKSRGELREMAEQGKLTASVVGNALVKELEKLRKEAASMPITVSAAFQQLQNDIALLVDKFNKATGVTKTIADAITFLRLNLDAFVGLMGTAVMIAGAYFAAFKGGALVVAGYTAAVTALTAAKTVFLARASLVGPAIAGLSMVMTTATTASFALAAGFTKLQVAAGLLFAAFAGWAIGDWLRENFLEAQLAGIAFVNMTMKGWEALKYTARSAWAAIANSFEVALSTMGGAVAWFLRAFGDGLDSLGLDDAAGKVREWAGSVEGGTRNTEDLSTELLRLRREYETATAAVDTITDEMADYAIESFNAKKATDQQAGAVKLLREAEAKAKQTKEELAAAERKRVEAAIAADSMLRELADNALQRDEEERVAVENQIKTAREYLEQVEYEADALTMTTQQRAVSNAVRELERQGIKEGTLAYDAYIEKIKAAVLRREQVDESLKNAREQRDQLNKISDEIGEGLTDSLFRAFENGKDFFSTLWEGIKNTVKSTVLRVVIDPVQNAVSQGISSIIQGGISGATGGGWGSLGNYATALSSLWTTGSATATTATNAALIESAVGSAGYGASSASGAAGASSGMAAGLYAAAIYAGFMKAQSDYGEGYNNEYAINAQNEVFGGNFGQWSTEGVLSSFFSSLGMNDKWSSILSGSTAVGKILDMLGLVSSQHRGSVVQVGPDGTSTLMSDSSQITQNYLKQTDDALRLLGGTSTELLNGLDRVFGGEGGFSALLKFAADNKDASIGQAFITRDGMQAGYVGNGTDFSRYATNGNEGFNQFVNDVAKATRQSIDAIDLPEWARKAFDAVATDADFEELAKAIQGISDFQKKLTSLQGEMLPLGGVFARVATLSSDAVYQLTEFAGGIEAFANQAANFVREYYSQDEQAAIQARGIADALAGVGVELSGLDTKEEFRALVEATDETTEAGRRQLAVLLAQAESFAQLSAFLSEQRVTLEDLAAAAPETAILNSINAQVEAEAAYQATSTSQLNALIEDQRLGNEALTAQVGQLTESTNDGNAQINGTLLRINGIFTRFDDGDALLVRTLA